MGKSRVWLRKAEPGHADAPRRADYGANVQEQRRGEQRDLARQAHDSVPATGGPREERGHVDRAKPPAQRVSPERSFVAAVTGSMEHLSTLGHKQEDGSPSKMDFDTGSSKEKPWELVRRKKKRRLSPVVKDACTARPSLGGLPRRRHSPPTKRTPSGVVEVCGKCRQPGHLMKDCRRVEVCRRCERPGHREARCPISPPATGTISLQGLKLVGAKEAKRHSKDSTSNLTGARNRGGEQEKLKGKTLLEESPHHVSLAVDEVMLEEKTHLDRYTVALVTKLRCIIDPKKVIEAVAAEHDPELKWEAETYDDRRFLLRCPSTSIARGLESRGEIDFPAFSASFEPWSTGNNRV
ncbi:hypothetical protein J5N97_011603 [Dioscorea zingiberensis]|uniref:CCHC-type domain-containing protein n=1 Tax=Dioscorea zingiberensis TaxID=325984 RepID=A0A9D5D3D7_9LILI|nr:hypothetical protein J5N97_011603 [Dioscorea zingiberensis]